MGLCDRELLVTKSTENLWLRTWPSRHIAPHQSDMAHMSRIQTPQKQRQEDPEGTQGHSQGLGDRKRPCLKKSTKLNIIAQWAKHLLPKLVTLIQSLEFTWERESTPSSYPMTSKGVCSCAHKHKHTHTLIYVNFKFLMASTNESARIRNVRQSQPT